MAEADPQTRNTRVSEVNGVSLAWDSQAPDKPGGSVIWAHGGSSSRAAEDAFALVDFDRLAETVEVLRYDARAHGESGLGESPLGYSWDHLAMDQLALADVAGFDHYVAAGASLGAATALWAAALAPERIDSLVLATPPTAWEVRDAAGGFYAKVADRVERDGAVAIAEIAAGAKDLTPPDPLVGRADIAAARAESLGRLVPERMATFYRGTIGANLPGREAVAEITVPTLILAWTGDPVHPVDTAAELADLMPNATLHLARTWDEFAAWTDLVSDFL